MANSNIKTNWDLNLLFSKEDRENLEAYHKKVEDTVWEFINKWKEITDYLESPEVLKQALDEYNKLQEEGGIYDNEAYFYVYSLSLDQANSDLKAKYNKIHEKYISLVNEIEFFTIKISKVSEEKQKEFIESETLKEYRQFLKHLFLASKHILSEKEEKIMNLKEKMASSNWVQMVESLISKEERDILDDEGTEATKNFSEILELISNKDKKVRDTAALALNNIFLEHLDVAEHEFNTVLENKKVNDLIRNYERPDESRHISDQVGSEIVDELRKVVTDNFDISKRYYELKAKLFGFERLQYHERTLEYGEIKTKYEFEKGYDLVQSTFAGLDPYFENTFVKYFEQGRVDAFPKKGKKSGAFCTDGTRTIPTIVFMNYVDSLNNVTTMAHEFGHAIHFELAKENNNSLQYGYGMAIAETASTFCEDFVLRKVLENASDEEKLTILVQKLDGEIATIFRQIAFYNFELEIHETFRKEGFVSKENIGEIFQKHMVSYMGDYVEQTEGSENWWIYVPHFRYMFYVYAYAFGLILSKSLQKLVRENHTEIDKVKKFMSAGGSNTPENIFMDLGFDISQREFWQTGIDEIKETMNEVEALATKLNKL